MEVSYQCGRRLYAAEHCPRSPLTFCEEHLPPGKHGCLGVAEEKGGIKSRLFLLLEVFAFLLVTDCIWWLANVVSRP